MDKQQQIRVLQNVMGVITGLYIVFIARLISGLIPGLIAGLIAELIAGLTDILQLSQLSRQGMTLG